MSQLEKLDGLCSGPPCPPWAGNGNKKSQDDPRARIFERVLQWVVLFIKGGSLLFCVLENVVGILHKFKGQPSFMARALGLLREECTEFAWAVHKLKATDYGLPQNRTRVFLIGVRKAVFGDCAPPPLLPWDRTWELRDFLSHGAQNTIRTSLTSNMQRNLKAHERKLKVMLRQGGLKVSDVVTVALDRAYGKVYKPRLFINKVPTLTTNNCYIFLLSPDFGKEDNARDFFRWFLPEERIILQGFPKACAAHLPQGLQVKASGNAYPVPLMAATLTPIVQGLCGKIQQWPMPRGTTGIVPNEVHALIQKLNDKEIGTCVMKKRPVGRSSTAELAINKKKNQDGHVGTDCVLVVRELTHLLVSCAPVLRVVRRVPAAVFRSRGVVASALLQGRTQFRCALSGALRPRRAQRRVYCYEGGRNFAAHCRGRSARDARSGAVPGLIFRGKRLRQHACD